MAEQVGCDRRAYEGGEEEEDDEADAAERELVAAEADPDELPVAAGLYGLRLLRHVERNIDGGRGVDAYSHSRGGEGTSKVAVLPPVRSIWTLGARIS